MLLHRGADQSAKDLRGRTSAAVCDMGLYDVDQASRAPPGTTSLGARVDATRFIDTKQSATKQQQCDKEKHDGDKLPSYL